MIAPCDIVRALDNSSILVPKELIFTTVLIKQCGEVPDMVDRWHHLMLLTLWELGAW